jgi:hypothetical protein
MDLSLRQAPWIVVPGEILLEHQLAMTDDDHSGNVGIGPCKPGRNAAGDVRPVKVMIINMFGGTPFPLSEASAFTGNLGSAIHQSGIL